MVKGVRRPLGTLNVATHEVLLLRLSIAHAFWWLVAASFTLFVDNALAADSFTSSPSDSRQLE